MPARPQDPWLGTVLAETYTIVRVLGAGGMGNVYEARHTRLPNSFAIKVLCEDMFRDERALARFRREAEIACRLKHRNIVGVLDFNTTPEGQPYIVMELLEGEDLSRRLRRCDRLPLATAVSIALQTAAALSAAHAQGVVHRDLKPQNIFLCRQADCDDFVKVLDFGISKLVGVKSSLTAEQAILGTPWYMAPEQAGGEAHLVDHRADLFALGAIVFEALAGKRPFDGENVLAVLHHVIHEEPASLIVANPEVPPAVETVVRRALAKQPEERYQQAEDFACALADAATGGADITGPRVRMPWHDLGAEPPSGDARLATVVDPEPAAWGRRALLLAGAVLALASSASIAVWALRRREPPVPAPASQPDARRRSRPDLRPVTPPADAAAVATAPDRSPDAPPTGVSAKAKPRAHRTRHAPGKTRRPRDVAPAAPKVGRPGPTPPKTEKKEVPKDSPPPPPRKGWILKPKIE